MAGALWLMVCAFTSHKRWRAYERFVQMHAPAIDARVAGGVGKAVVQRQRILVAAVEVLKCQADLAEARYSLLRYFRLVEAREQLRYVLMRDRFVRVPLHPEKADRVPGDEFEMHSYMVRVCCEQVRSALVLSLPGWLSLLVVLVPFFELAAQFPLGEPTLMAAVGVLLMLTELGLQGGLTWMLNQLVQVSPLLTPNQLHQRGADPREVDGQLRYTPLPPYLVDGHWTSDASAILQPSAQTGHAGKRWTRQQALYDVGSYFGTSWLRAACRFANVGVNGRVWVQRLTTTVLLTTSLYAVIAYEAATAGDEHAVFYLVPAALVFIVGKPRSIGLFACVRASASAAATVAAARTACLLPAAASSYIARPSSAAHDARTLPAVSLPPPTGSVQALTPHADSLVPDYSSYSYSPPWVPSYSAPWVASGTWTRSRCNAPTRRSRWSSVSTRYGR